MEKTMNRSDVLNTLFQVRIQVDSLHKSAEGITSAEYAALNDALNYYGSIVSYLWTMENVGVAVPDGVDYPNSRAEQLEISRTILQQAWGMSDEYAREIDELLETELI